MKFKDYVIALILVISLVMVPFSDTLHRVYVAGITFGYFIGLAAAFWAIPIVESLAERK